MTDRNARHHRKGRIAHGAARQGSRNESLEVAELVNRVLNRCTCTPEYRYSHLTPDSTVTVVKVCHDSWCSVWGDR